MLTVQKNAIDVYNNEIRPFVDAIGYLCKKNGIPFAAQFQVASDEKGADYIVTGRVHQPYATEAMRDVALALAPAEIRGRYKAAKILDLMVALGMSEEDIAETLGVELPSKASPL